MDGWMDGGEKKIEVGDGGGSEGCKKDARKKRRGGERAKWNV